MKIAVCLIATNKYKDFLPAAIEGINKYFLPDHEKEIHIFTDGIRNYPKNCIIHYIEPYKFPEATLYRYKIMTQVTYDTDYLFYLDVDMGIVEEVGDEVLGDLVAVRHPGYYWGGWGSNNVDKRSMAYLSLPERKKYYAGGFQGGKTETFYLAMILMAMRITADESNGVMAEWHDESHWNYHLACVKDIHELSPSYCMPESIAKKNYWHLSNFKPIILALEKDLSIRE